MSVHLYVTIQELLNRFSWRLILESFNKILTRSDFGYNLTTIIDTLHEDSHALLCAFLLYLTKYLSEQNMKQWTKVVKMINMSYPWYAFPMRYSAFEVIKQKVARMLELLIQAIHFLTCVAALTDINTGKWWYQLCLTPKYVDSYCTTCFDSELKTGSIFLWNDSTHIQYCMVSQPRRPQLWYSRFSDCLMRIEYISVWLHFKIQFTALPSL